MTMKTLQNVDPSTLKNWLDNDRAVLIDVREPSEYARERIDGARLVPLSGFDPQSIPGEGDKIGVFQCRTGNRTSLAADQLAATGFTEIYHLDGGLEAWKAANLPVYVNRKAPIDITRQVQLTAGSLVVLGALLSATVSPWYVLLSGAVGAGLILTGITGSCMMARMLGVLPWNRKAAAEVMA
jgi:rhodanese-related sulfurtransferase